MIRTKLTAGALAFVAAFVPFTGVAGAGSGGNNVVVAQNADPSREMRRLGLKVSTAGSTVDNENVAYARSYDCVGCRTLAVAVQAVLVPKPPSSATPKNAAVALNERCSHCETFAYAYQYVVSTGGPDHLTKAAKNRVASIKSEMARVQASGADFATIDARLDALANQLWTVINDDISAQGGTPSGTPQKA